jgi:hypothetical protein
MGEKRNNGLLLAGIAKVSSFLEQSQRIIAFGQMATHKPSFSLFIPQAANTVRSLSI